MTLALFLSLLACAGELGLLLLILWRGRASAMSLPLGLLTVALLGWNFASLAFGLTHQQGWLWVARALGPTPVPLALHVILVFVGRRRALRLPLWTAYVFLLSLSLVAAFAPWAPSLQAFVSSGAWEKAYLGLLVCFSLLGLGVLIQHVRSSQDDAEVLRTYLVFSAFLLLALTAVTELLPETLNPPRLGNLGTLIFNVLLTVVVLRLKLLQQGSIVFVTVLFLTMAFVSWLGFVSYSQALSSQRAAPWVAGMVLSAGALVAGRFVFQTREIRKARLDRLALLGRMSAQLAHDLKNPLAAAKGAAQFLESELSSGRSLEGQGAMVTLLSQQLERMERVVSQYQRMSRVEPQMSVVSINRIAQDSAGFSSFGVEKKIQLRVSVDDSIPASMLDADLLATAMENLIQNSVSMMESGGIISISTTRHTDEGREFQTLSVKDNGPGMTARVKERAFDEFFTTKASGSGLGLPFVRRVAEAHGGWVRLSSVEGQGTTVEICLPIRQQ